MAENSKKFRILLPLLSGLLSVIFVLRGAIYIFFNINFLGNKEIQILKAPEGPIKEKPKNSGGKIIDHQDADFYGILDKDIDNSLLKIASNSDVVIWDGMYTMQEIKDKKGWGHSSIEDGVIFHKKSKAKKLFISHHAPERSDKDLDSMSKTMLPKGVFFAKENQKIKLT